MKISLDISLRDYFAAQALPAMIQMTTDFSLAGAKAGLRDPAQLMKPGQIVDAAYEIADAMIQRSQIPPTS